MNNGGDAAEQVVRLSLEGLEVVAKLTGSAALNVGALLKATFQQEHKTKGKVRLANMIKSGKPLKVFSIRNKDLRVFTEQAKTYGVLYNVLKNRTDNSPDAEVDIIVREEDGSKIQRIVDRFALAKIDKASIMNEAQRDIAERKKTEKDYPVKTDGQRVVEEAMGVFTPKERNASENPMPAKTEKSPPSRQLSKREDSRLDMGISNPAEEKKPSVRAEIKRYQTERKKHRESERSDLLSRTPDFEHRQTIPIQPVIKKDQKER